jgi:hypothetical protein
MMAVPAAQQIERGIIPQRKGQRTPRRFVGGFERLAQLHRVRGEVVDHGAGCPGGGFPDAGDRDRAGRRVEPAPKDETGD